MANAAMILSVCGLFCFGFITGVIAIIFGSIALSGMSRTGNKEGQGTAIAAIVLGAVDCAGWLIWLAVRFG